MRVCARFVDLLSRFCDWPECGATPRWAAATAGFSASASSRRGTNDVWRQLVVSDRCFGFSRYFQATAKKLCSEEVCQNGPITFKIIWIVLITIQIDLLKPLITM